MLRGRALFVVVVALLLPVWSGSATAASRQDAALDGAKWLSSKQRSNGAFFDKAQRADQTAEMLAAAIAGGVEGRTVDRALSYIGKNGKKAATRGAFTGRIVAGIYAGGADPQDHGGTDYVALLHSQYNAGAFDTTQMFDNLLGANGAVAVDGGLPEEAVAYIRTNACAGGGFGYENSCTSGPDVDTTAWAINVLAAAGYAGDPVVDDARTFLLSVQHGDGGFGFTEDKPTSADSTGLVLAAIEALGEKATSSPWRQSDGDDPVRALSKLQLPSGAFEFTAKSNKANAMSTTNAVPGMAAVAYPVPRLESPEPDAGTAPKEPVATPTPWRPRDPVHTVTPRRTDSPGAARTTEPSATPRGVGQDDDARPFGGGAIEDVEPPGGSIFRSPWLWGGILGGGAAAGLFARYMLLRRR